MDVPSHRAALPTLLAQNPNYFGNLPGSDFKPVTPVSYIARASFQPDRDPCFEALLPQVRAILSWSVPPPATGLAPQDWTPIFGNVIDDHVQIPPRPFFLADVLATLDIAPDTLPSNIQAGLDIPIPVPPPAPVGLAELVKDYSGPEPGRKHAATFTPVSPVSGETGPAPGDPWTLNTQGMSPCAYTVQVQAVNRVIVSSVTVGLYSPIAAVGFALGV
jgi:hypothetical protein